MPDQMPNAGQQENNKGVDYSHIQHFLDIQTKELEVKAQELRIRENEISHNKDIASQSITAQLEDSKLRQEFFLKSNFRKALLIGVGIIAGFTFLCIAMYLKQTQFAESVVDMIIGAIGGFFAGRASITTINNNTKSKDE